jgi:uncharacterized protein with PIN domain
VVLDASGIAGILLAEPAAGWVRTHLKAGAEPIRMSWVNAAEVALLMERAAPGGGSAALTWHERLLKTDLARVLHPGRP